MADLITLTLDGREVKTVPGTLLVEAASQIGIEIPVFCYHPKLKSVGACRMCLVQIEKMPRLQTACTTPVAGGMVVHTASPDAAAAQAGVLELLLANHPLDCPICDKAGECPLQDNTFRYGPGTSRYQESKRTLDKAFPLSDRIVLDQERCIMCYRCVRFHQEVTGDEALAAVERGGQTRIAVLDGETYDSIFSGNTIELCPVGALTSRQYRFKARPWDLRRTPSICEGCAVGCNVELHARGGQILRVVARENPEVDDGWLCDYGRFDTLPPEREARLQPMVRSGNLLAPTSWTEALRRAAELLKSRRSAIVASANLTNEAVWLLANEVAPRLEQVGPGPLLACWPQPSPWPVKGRIADLPGCRSLVLVGLDVWFELPVLALWLRKAVLGGGKLVALGSNNGLYRDSAHWLRVSPERLVDALGELVAALEGRPPHDVEDCSAASIAAAARSLESRPSAVLGGPYLAEDPAGRGLLQRLATMLGAGEGRGGMVGCPALGANARGVGEFAPRLTHGAEKIFEASQNGEVDAALLLGDASRPGKFSVEAWPRTGQARLVVAASTLPPGPDRVEVFLPLAHLYEQAGTLTNLEGRVQAIQPGGSSVDGARPDWSMVGELAQALGVDVLAGLDTIQQRMAETNPAYAQAIGHRAPERAPSTVGGARIA